MQKTILTPPSHPHLSPSELKLNLARSAGSHDLITALLRAEYCRFRSSYGISFGDAICSRASFCSWLNFWIRVFFSPLTLEFPPGVLPCNQVVLKIIGCFGPKISNGCECLDYWKLTSISGDANPHQQHPWDKFKLAWLPVWQVEVGLNASPPRKLGMVLTLSIGGLGEATSDGGSWQSSMVKPRDLFDNKIYKYHSTHRTIVDPTWQIWRCPIGTQVTCNNTCWLNI